MRAVLVSSALLLACGGAPSVQGVPTEAPPTVDAALADGLTLADVTLAEGRGQRGVLVSPEARVTVDAWGAAVARTRAPAAGTAPATPATLNVHVALAALDAEGRVTRTLANRFDGAPARAMFARGRRVLALVAPDALEPGAWRVWHAYALTAEGALDEPAMGLARGAELARVFAP